MRRFPLGSNSYRFRQFPAGLGLILLAGCMGSNSPPPAVEVRTVTVTKEIQRPCAVTIPARPAKLSRPLPSDPVALAAALTLKLMEYDAPGGFADKATAALATCTKP